MPLLCTTTALACFYSATPAWNATAVDSDGRMFWIQAAYTTSDQFPYASPHRAGFAANVNYKRNSAKVAADMYDGSMQFYAMDPKDPILAAYSLAFPGVFKDLASISPDLKAHLRYPQDLFAI